MDPGCGGAGQRAPQTLDVPSQSIADIFLSYAREDRQKAELLSRALEHAGWSVWWDREIIDHVPRAPNDPPLEQIDAASAREFDYAFDVSAAAPRAVLRVVHGGQTGEIALDFTAR